MLKHLVVIENLFWNVFTVTILDVMYVLITITRCQPECIWYKIHNECYVASFLLHLKDVVV